MMRWHAPFGLRILLVSMLFSIINLAHAANQAAAIEGVWSTQDGKARVQIVEQDNRFKGRIVWLKQPLFPANDPQGMAGKPKVDRKNPDNKLRTRPIMGLPLLDGFHYAGDAVWRGGTIYDPESGKTYSCNITLMQDGSLRIRGYVGIPLFGRTEIWKRYHPDTATNAASAVTHNP
ncbi:MAG: DUF2147 domain-containing protein [Gammaproteobacteria bacterium]|nr:DUF2147 domain-containing protein [Gammaproteobacteria bacterium]MDE2345727.1 DUF2147 domain-containing protein [Gammaproteobacteria bacterium]